jgi:hypothetical protein
VTENVHPFAFHLVRFYLRASRQFGLPSRSPRDPFSILLKPDGRRIYEGGGGVKGKIVVPCFEWRSEQSPSPEARGMRAQPHFSPGD